MKNEKIIALWNRVFFIILSIGTLLLGICYIIDTGYYSANMFIPVLCLAFTIVFFCIGNLKLPYITFNHDFKTATFNAVPWGELNKSNIDRWNWEINCKEVTNVEIVKLSKTEKIKFTSGRFIFNKYLQITLINGHKKFIYIALFSSNQIKKIIKTMKN